MTLLQYYKDVLEAAIQLADLYEAEIRNRDDLMTEGFCQGEIFRDRKEYLCAGLAHTQRLADHYGEKI